MAQLTPNPRLAQTVGVTAGARIGRAVSASLSPATVRRVQQVLGGVGLLQDIFGPDGAHAPQPLLGGMTLDQARQSFEMLRDAQLARKNLWFIRIIDYNPPAAGDGPDYSPLFNLFATDVSYSPVTMTGEKVPIGSANMDRLTGTEAIELQVTTMDDFTGSLKRWFSAKCDQATHDDGTFGLPMEYLVDIELFHATPQADARAYKLLKRFRPQAMQHDLSRRAQEFEEIAMTFSQFDTFGR